MLGSKTNVVNRVLIVIGTIGVSLGWVCASDEPLVQSEVELVSLVQTEDEIEAISSMFLSQQAGTIGVGELGFVLVLHPDLKKQIELSDWPTMNPYAKYNAASLGLGRIWSDDDNPKSKNVISELDVSLSKLSGKQTEFFDRRLEFGAAILLRHAYIVEGMHRVELESI